MLDELVRCLSEGITVAGDGDALVSPDLVEAEIHATALLHAMTPNDGLAAPVPSTVALPAKPRNLYTLLTLPDHFLAFVMRTAVMQCGASLGWEGAGQEWEGEQGARGSLSRGRSLENVE
jgi:hypothetical protein